MARPRERFIEPGTRYGRTEVLYELENCRPRKLRMRCDCGTEHTSAFGDVYRGQVTSCGCLRSEAIKQGLHRKHGLFHQPEYAVWNMIKARCYNPNNNRFSRYGARGIVMCDEWRDSFELFFRDMGARPSPGHSIERIDNDGPYSLENCRWATRTEQARNKQNNRRYDWDGLSLTASEWAEIKGLPKVAFRARLEIGWDIERALTQPFRRSSPRKAPRARAYQCASRKE